MQATKNGLKNNLQLNHFTQFIYNQNNLKELIINKFDLCFQEIKNDNIKILNINYEKNISIMKYKLLEEIKNSSFNYFPKLEAFYYGGDCSWIFNLQMSSFPSTLKSIKLISINNKKYKISKILKKFKKHGKEVIIDFIDKTNENEEGGEAVEEEEEEEISENEYDNFDKNCKPVNIYKGPVYFLPKHSSDKTANRKYMTRLYYADCIADLKERQFFKKWEEKELKQLIIFEKSVILQEYEKKSKILGEIKSVIRNRKEGVKLKYRASENKFNFDDFLNLKEFMNNSSNNYYIIMKLDNNLYIIIENEWWCNIFTVDERIGRSFMRINFSQDKFELGKLLIIQNSFSLGLFVDEIQLKNIIIPKQTSFSVLELEVFQKTDKN